MNTILEQILIHKQKEITERKKEVPVSKLEKQKLFEKKTRSLSQSITDKNKTGIIAEYKRKSPSKGIINNRDSVETVTQAYATNGASGISILTDHQFFAGSLNDLLHAENNEVPLLRKDFMLDEYQLIEAKAYGADAILLIAACMTVEKVKQLAETARGLGLEVLLELHEEAELDHICDEVSMIGINNRNLKNFEVDIENAARLAEKIDDRFIKIAESGITNVQEIQYLKQRGFKGFLIGEYFMKQTNPMEAFKIFVNDLKQV